MHPKPSTALLPLAILLLSPTSGSQAAPLEAPTPLTPQETSVRTRVTDLPAFEVFIATRPTFQELCDRYPGLHVQPARSIVSREMRIDRSRYLAELDAEGRVVGGSFQ